MAKKSGMAERDLRSLVDQQIRSAVGYDGSTVTEERAENWRYYRGEKFGNERPGRSTVVSRDVMDTVEWILPSLLESFHGTDEPIEFEPSGPEDEEVAAQATDYVNHIYRKDNPGFRISYDWIKDGLVGKLGIVKHWWDVCEKVTEESYSGLSDDEFALIGQEDSVEIIAHTAYPGPEGQYHDIKVRKTDKYGRVKVDTLPAEEFLISPKARNLDTAGFTCHRRAMPRSDLIAMGYERKLVESIPADSDDDENTDSIERYDDEGRIGEDDDRTDTAMQQVTVSECYVRVDFDGDGIAEMRKVVLGGKSNGIVLENEMWDEHPFKVFSPILLPHTVWGMAAVDAVKDLQLIKSTIQRQMLDGIYLTTNPRLLVNKNGGVELDDLLKSAPGSIIRVNDMTAVMPLDQPWDGAKAFPMLEYIDRVRDARTGTGQSALAMNPDSLNNQAGSDANSRLMTQAESRIKLIARVFAETAFAPLARSILKLATKHQDKPRVMRLRNKFVPIDPRSWNADMDINVKVGLGTGDKQLQFQAVAGLLQKQEQILLQLGPNNPLCGLPQYFNGLKEFTRLASLPSVDPYFTDPAAPDPATGQPKEMPPPPPDPKMVEVQQKGEIEKQKLAMQQQADATKLQSQAQMETAKMQMEFQLKREQIAAEMGLKREQLQAELMLKREQMQAELEMKRELGIAGVVGKVAVGTSEVRPGGEAG